MKEFLHTIQQPRVAASFWYPAVLNTVTQWQQSGVEVAELRLDLWGLAPDASENVNTPDCSTEAAVDGLLSYTGMPRIATARAREEGGQWRGSGEERLQLLLAAIAYCEAVDIELAATIRPQVTAAVNANTEAKNCALIVSQHNFLGADTLVTLNESARRAFDEGADIYKNASIVETEKDLSVLKDFLQQWAGGPLIIIGMGDGEMAKQARRELPTFGSRLAFAAAAGKSAPGQLSLSETVAAVNSART